MSHKLISEFIGTFCLVFAGTGAIIANNVHNGVVTHVGIALTFGLVVMAMIYAIGDVSGAHINPAVTVAFWLAGRFPKNFVLSYVGCQCRGALTASVVLKVLFLGQPNFGATSLGSTSPAGEWWQSFVMEVVLTFMLMFVILNVSTGAKEKGAMAGAAIGAVVTFEALFAGPVSGASMNPARSIGPAIASGEVTHLWIYLLAPVIGACLAVCGCRCLRDEECCRPSDENKKAC